MTPRATRLTLLALIAATAGVMTWLAVYQVDDAFIVYRYARNLGHGAGFVFNPGERVEGVTCFLWTLLLAPFAALGIDLPTVAPVLTAACGLGVVALVARRHADLEGRGAIALRDLLPSLLLAATPAFLYWSVGALETVPFALLVALAVRDHARERSEASRRPRSAVWLALASLMRPETPVLVAALGTDRVWRAHERGALRAGLLETVRWLGLIAAGFIPFLLFRRVYFGAWLPNTYFAKTGAPLAARAAAGWLYLQDYAASVVPSFGAQGGVVISLGLVLLAGIVVVAVSDSRLRPEGLVVVALALACVFEGGDWMVLHRFFVPALPSVAVISGALLLRGAAAGRAARAGAILVTLLCVVNGGARTIAERNGGRGLLVQSEGYRHAHLEVAKYLAQHATVGDAVALMDVGMIGWYAPELHVIDITGLTDHAIARAPGGFIDKRYPVADLLARRPRFIVIVPGFPADERIHGDPSFRSDYTFRFSENHRFNWDPPDSYYLYVFERERAVKGGRFRSLVIPVFTLATFLSASLLFLVQPMVGKLLLPLLGGSAAVWTTCMVFFQAGLLAGYAYAHVTTSRLPLRAQVALHAVVVALPLLVLPLSRHGLVPPAGDRSPIPWLLSTLAILAGAPFFALAATGPLVQRWLHTTDHPSAGDPYFLYAASNLGSFGGLLLYPLLLEPMLPIEAHSVSQSSVWTAGYVAFILVVLAAGLLAARARKAPHAIAPEASPALRRRLLWVVLAFVPSSAVLGVTQYVTTEIAAVPLLWVVPLALYLLTFVVAFSPRVRIPPAWAGLSLAVLAVATAASMSPAVRSHGRMLVVVHLATLVALGLSLHGRLAASRPGAGRLTEFYLWVALGGVLGGAFNAIVAPLVFRSVVEYPLALFLAVLLRPRWPEGAPERHGRAARLLDAVVPLSIGALALVVSRLQPDAPGPTPWSLVTLQAGVPAILCLAIVGWPLRFALTLGVLLGFGWWQANAPNTALHRERTFFGVHRVVPTFGPVFRREENGVLAEPERREFVMLTHGATRHGLQAVDPALRGTPTTYYHRTGPLGQVWAALDLDATAHEIGVVGLGAGTVAAYGRSGQRLTYFEIDPAVARIARDPRFFSYLSDSRATVDVVLGDGRLSLARTDDGRFDVLILDAFSSDAVPVHLLTREAVALYLRKLAPGGVLLLHLTNQYVQLEDVVSAVAGDLHVPAAIQWDKTLEPESVLEGKDASVWAIFARSPDRLAPILRDERWYPLPLAPRPGGPPPDRALWTDDRSDLFSVLKHF